LKIINSKLLSDLSSQAKVNPRLRKNLNLHKSYDEPSQRLLNAMEPDSYIRPHRHLRDPKPESFVGLRGKMVLLVFSDTGVVEQVIPFGPGEDVVGVDIPPGVWHTVICLQEGSVFYETKPGPFIPTYKKDMASWAPEEGAPDSSIYFENLKSLAIACDEKQNLQQEAGLFANP
jgi:cupin fold WbuC family metalloprotein